jgi:hypothetical protein
MDSNSRFNRQLVIEIICHRLRAYIASEENSAIKLLEKTLAAELTTADTQEKQRFNRF